MCKTEAENPYNISIRRLDIYIYKIRLFKYKQLSVYKGQFHPIQFLLHTERMAQRSQTYTYDDVVLGRQAGKRKKKFQLQHSFNSLISEKKEKKVE